MIHVIDYKTGNISSVVNMLNYLGLQNTISSNPDEIQCADKIVLPGVGAFDSGVLSLRNLGLDLALKESAKKGAKILGICLGMQLLMEHSEEGKEDGLGLIKGDVVKLNPGNNQMPIPHMGWNEIEIVKDSLLFNPAATETNRFYFVHSYCVNCQENNDIVALTSYGSRFASVIKKNFIMGVQFHPEKSHKYGKELFKNFGAA